METFETVFQQIHKLGIVPVVTITDAAKAVPLALALDTGGLSCIEVTFRTAGADAAIHAIKDALPNMLVGAGTVLTRQQVDEAMHAGASFIVSPGLNPEVVRYCIDKGMPVLPGCCTPSDIEQALSLGLRVVKFFPAEAAGGLAMVKALSAPYGSIRFVPTGGVTPGIVGSYLSFDRVLACGGSWMVREDWMAAGAFSQVTQTAREAVDQILGFELTGITLNGISVNNSEALSHRPSANSLVELLNASVFDGGALKGLHNPRRGAVGVAVFKTRSLTRAAYYLAKRGAAPEEDTAEPGFLRLRDEINGLMVYITQG